MKNTGYLYYKEYFNTENITQLNKEILSTPLSTPIFDNEKYQSFDLKTTYPGLLIGSGYGHDYKHTDSKKTDEGFKVGFYFEHTSGMPIIPGSSLKGLLRSVFPQMVDESRKKPDVNSEIVKSKYAYIIGEIHKLINKKLSNDDVDNLEAELFDGIVNGKKKSIYQRSIFYGAEPLEVKNKKKQLFDEDYITPHKNKDGIRELDALSNPTPIKFLKVSPNVVYRFYFTITDVETIRGLKADKVMELFKTILLDFGIGAKTNVGYGQFDEV